MLKNVTFISRGIFLICLMLMVFFLFLSRDVHAKENPESDLFQSLQKRLVEKGFSEKWIQDLYAPGKISFEVKGVSLYFVHSESSLNYDQFLEKQELDRAVEFMNMHQEAFHAAGARFGVEEEVIAAILLVETRMGAYLGTRSVLNTLSTMAALANAYPREYLWKKIREKTALSYDRFTIKAEEKAGWAFGELVSFLKFARRENLDPHAVKGSYAGAMGLCQFMPSNALRLAVDGNQDGKIDLFSPPDAVASIGAYLAHHGWKPGMSASREKKVIMRYNYSTYYAETVLKIADWLGKNRGK